MRAGVGVAGWNYVQRLEDVLTTWFRRYRIHWPYEARLQRNRVIGELRQLVARVCIDALEPDLGYPRRVSALQAAHGAGSRRAGAPLPSLRSRCSTPRPQRVSLCGHCSSQRRRTSCIRLMQRSSTRIIIGISSTRRVSSCGTTRIRVDGLRREIVRFGTALKRATDGDMTDVVESRDVVQSTLRTVMARTERVVASEAHDAMVEEPEVKLTITSRDIRQYVAADSIFRGVDARDPIAFWKSAPYLLHFMHGYKFNSQLDEAITSSPKKIADLLRQHAESVLHEADLHAWSELDPGNAKLRDLARDLLDGGFWRLLWMPPTVPYWLLGGSV